MSHNNSNSITTNPPAIINVDALQSLEIPNIEEEIADMLKGFHIPPPRITIEHNQTGRHKLLIDYGEAYGDERNYVYLENNELYGIICYAQMIRALWLENELLPHCASVDDRPTVPEPISASCLDCQCNHLGSLCKPKVRLLVLTWITEEPLLVVFTLSPTSIKRWRSHIGKLARSKIPYIAVVTKFSLVDVRKNTFRWSEVDMCVERVVNQDELEIVRVIREKARKQFISIEDEDFNDVMIKGVNGES